MRWRFATAIAVGLVATIATSTFVAAATVTVTATKTNYEFDETVFFTVENHLDEAVWLNGFPYWAVYEEAAGGHLGPCVGLPTLHRLSPGASETHEWFPWDCHEGIAAVEGLHRLEVTWWTDSDPEWRVSSTPFCLGSGCAVATSAAEHVRVVTWGKVRGLYR